MFDAEKLLGALLGAGFGSGMGRQGANLDLGGFNPLGHLGRMENKAAIGLGVLGIAIAAYEHWQESRPQGVSAATPPPPPPAAPPMAPMAESRAPLPNFDAIQQEARLYIRGMIAAASADRQIDEAERTHILNQIEGAGIDSEGRAFLLAELERPADIDALVAEVRDSQQGFRLYLSALLSIRVDSEAERDFLRLLGSRLGLSAETLAAVHQRYGVEL